MRGEKRQWHSREDLEGGRQRQEVASDAVSARRCFRVDLHCGVIREPSVKSGMVEGREVEEGFLFRLTLNVNDNRTLETDGEGQTRFLSSSG